VPCTVHVAIGTDIVHMHPHVSGAALGEATMIDFRRLCSVVATMEQGVWLNLGSAVILPEVFLKAVSVAHNFGHSLDGLVTADLIELVQKLGQPRVLVVGDLMLDRYVWGDAERISQEAPVILLHADKKEERLGGASSVASMLRALGARVSLAGVVGNDLDGGT